MAPHAKYLGPTPKLHPAQETPAPHRRRRVNPTTCERVYTDAEREFMLAIDRYKRACQRPYPTCSEILEILHALGYRQVAERTPLPGCYC